jgi:hypothetical protein
LVIALLAATTAAVAESNATPAPSAPVAEAAPADVADASDAAAPVAQADAVWTAETAPVPAEVAKIDSEELAAKIQAALAEAQISNVDSAAIAQQVEAALADAQVASVQAYALAAPLSSTYAPQAQCVAGECPFATTLALGSSDELLKALEELQASGDLTAQGAERLKELLKSNAPHAFFVPQEGVAGTAPQVFAFPKADREWRTMELPEGSTQMFSAPFQVEIEKGQRLFGAGGNTAALEERIAKLEAQLEELSAKLEAVEAGN